MADVSGTIEKVGLFLANSLTPLSDRLQNSRVMDLFAEFGLALPQTALNENLVISLEGVGDGIAEIETILAALIDAIDDEDIAEIISQGINLIIEVKNIIGLVETVATEINNIGRTGNLTPAEFTDFLANLPSRLVETLIVENVETHQPFIFHLLHILGVFGIIPKNATSTSSLAPYYVEKKIIFDQIPKIITAPDTIMTDLYDWGSSDFQDNMLLTKLNALFQSVGIRSAVTTLGGDRRRTALDFMFLRMVGTSGPSPEGLEITVKFPLEENQKLEIPISDTVKITIDAKLPLPKKTGITFTPPANINFIPISGAINGDIGLSLTKSGSDGVKLSIISLAGSSGVFADALSIGMDAGVSWNPSTNAAEGQFGVFGAVDGGRVLISTEGSDGFLANLLSGISLDSNFDIKFGWRTDVGLYFEGSSALEIVLPTHIDLGLIQLENLAIEIGVEDSTIYISLGTNVLADLGPFKATVQEIGTRANFLPVDNFEGNIGFADFSMDFKPPSGVGLQINTPAVKGGGFLYIDVDKGEYAGVAELTIQGTISLKAIGIINTKLPNGEDGFALLLLITAEFTPIQLGFGFTLNGVGGLIGANRGMNLMAIREGVRNNTLDHILFPDDPVANAPAIIANLNSVFPISEGNHSFGIMGIIGWGTPTLLEVELGLMITFPSFDLAVIGKLSTSLPDKEAAILQLNVAFAGTMSFEKKYFYFDASIFDSRILNFSLSGDMAVRILWGDEPNFVLSVGGFHPDFVPPPLELGHLKRITLNLLADDNPRLTLACYFAVTSNTVQFGASIDFYFAISGFKVVGFLYFHALFQFDPFYFNISIGAGLAVKAGNTTILSIEVSGQLEGPTPWKFKGKGSFKILFVKISVSISETWGETRDTSLPAIEVYPKLEEAILDDRNWAAALPTNSTLTSLRDITTEDETEPEVLTIHPFGSLALQQRVVPLKNNIELFGNQEPSDYKRFELDFQLGTEDIDTTDKKDFFAPAQFFEFSDAQKVSQDAYVKYPAGISADTTDKFAANHHVNREVYYELEIIDQPDQPSRSGLYIENAAELAHWARGSAIARSDIGRLADAKILEAGKKVKFNQESYTIVKRDNLTRFSGVQVEGTELELQQMLDEIIQDDPMMESELMVVSTYELL